MKGILKIYHPEETLQYNIEKAYCKAIYSNEEHFLEVDIITDDSLDDVEDDSLKYHFSQINLSVFDFPLASEVLEGKAFQVEDTDEEEFTEMIFNNEEDALIDDNQLSFSKNEEGVLEVIWKGKMEDVFTETDDKIDFKLKCHFKEDCIEIDDEDE